MQTSGAGAALHAVLERGSIAAVGALSALLLWRLAPALVDPAAWPWLCAAALAAAGLADLASGLVHWCADRLLSEDVPHLGPIFVRPFREHHERPQEIARHGFVETNANTCIAALPLLAAAGLWVEPPRGAPVPLAVNAFVLSLALWTCLTNQIHKWAHVAAPPAWVRRLQRARLILSPVHHSVHHSAPFDTRFCITTGWWNPLLDHLRLLPALERGLRGTARAQGL